MRIALLLILHLLQIQPPLASEELRLASGVSFRKTVCQINGNELELEEIRLSLGSGFKLKAFPNPHAKINPECPGGYGGQDLHPILKKLKPLAMTNGNFFRTKGKGYAPMGLLWSDRLFEPLHLKGGKALILADDSGLHKINITLDVCGKANCATLINHAKGASKKMNTTQLISFLKTTHPALSLAFQSNMDLSEGTLDQNGKLRHFSQCQSSVSNSEKDEDFGSSWKCRTLPRTVLCGKKDGSVSLITVPRAYVYDIASGFRLHGKCGTECSVLVNLDGGGSTQMAYLDPKSKKYKISGAPQSLLNEDVKLCGETRPVDHYFGIVK